MHYKQPRSVQVVIFQDAFRKPLYLLLKRLPGNGGFWQPVTGSLEDGETHTQAAVREVREETGFLVREAELIELGLTNTFEIAESWRPKYAPGVTHNEEVCFGLSLASSEVQLDLSEHEQSTWVDYEAAVGMVYWDSNRQALAAMDKRLERAYS